MSYAARARVEKLKRAGRYSHQGQLCALVRFSKPQCRVAHVESARADGCNSFLAVDISACRVTYFFVSSVCVRIQCISRLSRESCAGDISGLYAIVAGLRKPARRVHSTAYLMNEAYFQNTHSRVYIKRQLEIA